MLPPYNPCQPKPDFHAVVSISIGELYKDDLINWGEDESSAPSLSWRKYAYNDEQYDTVCDMFVKKFWLREIAICPLKTWSILVVETFRELMYKYRPLYKALYDGNFNILQDFDNYEKERNIFSDFPATQLSTQNQDYASNANDRQRETVQEGNILDKVAEFKNKYNSINVMLLDEMAPIIFSSLYTVNINGF